ncbi:glutamyl-tRNA reductase [Agitococcus lubricus]|uniref:Glutamyl-tRNA reductase n=1 Tax=Agitococcus lubricus TaxID=1077255 RepID=A0A2T5ITM6_9GAMM|nr:glutamyl-tRNA reductase [Agitococcus lubricus]PTQ87222.1 glutamyl-tRNA reductase [Agitococcus lubricus]
MGLIALGINHKTASVQLREKVAFLPDTLTQALQAACDSTGVSELAILSTCNRTEFYGFGDNSQAVLSWLSQQRHLSLHELKSSVYVYEEQDALRHLMRVASGLDSMVLGEPQIFGQVKVAYQHAQQAGTLGQKLDRVFQQTFSAVKRVRTETAIGANPVSIGFAAVQLAKQIFSDFQQTKALLVGAGEMISLVAKHLKEQGVQQITIANRSLERAENLAQELGGAKVVLLSDLADVLSQADIVISCTGSQLPVIGKGMVERALKKRRYRPMAMIDIAVPRDIEPEVDDLDDVYLYTVDDLESTIEENRRARQQAAQQAEQLIEQCAAQFLHEQRAQAAQGLVTAYRQQADEFRVAELAKAQQALAQGANPHEILERLSRSLMNKLVHSPSVQLKQAAAHNEHEKLKWAAQLLGLNSKDN